MKCTKQKMVPRTTTFGPAVTVGGRSLEDEAMILKCLLPLVMLAALILILAIIRLSGLWSDLEEAIDAMGGDDGEWL